MDLRLERAAKLHLERLTGQPGVSFHAGQLEAIANLVDGGGRLLVVQRTGWGKSAVYFIATKMLRERRSGPTVLLSPLLALMRNQIDAAQRMGLNAVSVNSSNRETWQATTEQLERDDVDLILVSPERLANQEFLSDMMPLIGRRAGLVVIDEAHCISDWGHDFRADYRRISRLLQFLPPGSPVLACTATANDRVVEDIEAQLGDRYETIRGPLSRHGLALSVAQPSRPEHRYAWLANALPTWQGTGIVYCLTTHDADLLAAWLIRQGIEAVAYHGQLSDDLRQEIEGRFIENQVKVVVATSALGMGYDKPDVSFVVHFQHPSSLVSYYQQVGRAGRQLETSHGYMLRGHEDREIQDFFIGSAFPEAGLAEATVALLEAADEPVGLAQLQAHVNLPEKQLRKLLTNLEVDGAIFRNEANRYQRSANAWAFDAERVEDVTAARRREQLEMDGYADSGSCRMVAIRAALDDLGAQPCGICDNCMGAPLSLAPPPGLVAEARTFILNGGSVDGPYQGISIAARRLWPGGLDAVRGAIPEGERFRRGTALSHWRDGGWGDLVADAKVTGSGFPAELIARSADVLRANGTASQVSWVTAIPSSTSMRVQEFAEALALELGLPFVASMVKSRATEPQKSMRNSAQQVLNLLGSVRLLGPLPSGPVLLVDDVCDSRWTFAVTARELREAGIEAVDVFALTMGMRV